MGRVVVVVVRGHWKTSTRTQGPFAHPVLSVEIQE